MRHEHTHNCTVCQTPTPCGGELERNHDGWPETVCSFYHLSNGSIADIFCEDCDACECGEPATQTWDQGIDHAYWLPMQPRLLPVCAECYEKHDNYDGPEVTFDDALGAQGDASMRMDAARRLK